MLYIDFLYEERAMLAHSEPSTSRTLLIVAAVAFAEAATQPVASTPRLLGPQKEAAVGS